MDKIEKIRKYIEERLVYYPTIYTQAGRELVDLRNFLDTLSEEPGAPEFPETFEICLYDGRTPNKESCNECSTTCSVRKEEPDKSLEEEIKKEMVKLPFFIRGKDQIAFARHFAEWGEEHLRDTTKMTDKSLKEAAEEYTQKMLESWRFDSTGCRPLREPFIAGAEWQKQQMMKDSVEGEVHPDDCEIWVNLIGYGYKFNDGDKVRIIVLKAEE